jgi:hypothetical protein
MIAEGVCLLIYVQRDSEAWKAGESASSVAVMIRASLEREPRRPWAIVAIVAGCIANLFCPRSGTIFGSSAELENGICELKDGSLGGAAQLYYFRRRHVGGGLSIVLIFAKQR